MLASISAWTIINIILILIVAYILGMQIYLYLVGKRVSKVLTNDEFKQGMRSAQIIDLREADAFKNGRIMGARNTLSEDMQCSSRRITWNIVR